MDHFVVLMYLVTQFAWPAVREFHAAVLFEIECGRARWGDMFEFDFCSDYIIDTCGLMIYYQCNMIVQEKDYSELHARVNTCTCLLSSYPIIRLVMRMGYKKKK